MYTDDPKTNPEAEFIDIVPYVNEAYMKMGKSSSSSDVGTGGMKAKMVAARIATGSGADMIITMIYRSHLSAERFSLLLTVSVEA